MSLDRLSGLPERHPVGPDARLRRSQTPRQVAEGPVRDVRTNDPFL